MTEKDLEIQELRRELQAYKTTFSEDAVLRMAAQVLGTTPRHLRELVRAKKDGQLIVLPCNAGELWYSKDSGRPIEIDGFRYESYAGLAVLYHYPGWRKGSCNSSYFLEHFTQDKTAAALKGGAE